MHASISVGYIYVINEMLNMICMYSILMIEDYIYIYMDFKLFFYGEFTGFHTMSYFIFSCIYIGFEMKLVERAT